MVVTIGAGTGAGIEADAPAGALPAFAVWPAVSGGAVFVSGCVPGGGGSAEVAGFASAGGSGFGGSGAFVAGLHIELYNQLRTDGIITKNTVPSYTRAVFQKLTSRQGLRLWSPGQEQAEVVLDPQLELEQQVEEVLGLVDPSDPSAQRSVGRQADRLSTCLDH